MLQKNKTTKHLNPSKQSMWFSCIIFLALACVHYPETTNQVKDNSEITAGEILDHIRVLSADEMKGRYPGTEESHKAADYIIEQMRKSGVQPGGTNGFRQEFDFVADIELGKSNTLTINKYSFAVKEDFIPLGFSESGIAEASVIFAGYGFAIDDSIKWDNYADVSAEKKWVLILRGGPDGDNPHSDFGPHTALRKKVLVARDKGAKGVLFVSPLDPDSDDELIPLKYDQSFSGAGISAIHISQSVANSILSSSGRTLKKLQDHIGKTQIPNSFSLDNVIVQAEVSLVKEIKQIENIVGWIEGNDPGLNKEFIVIGAHFDHLGFGGEGSGSLMPDTIAVHNGADDNASGTAGLLELGQKLSANRHLLKRSILLLAFNAEEEGTLGAKYFTDSSTVDLESIITMINMDMIGRMRDKKITVGGTGTSPDFETILNSLNENHNLDLKMSPEGFGPSDHSRFYVEDIPVLFFFTGSHEDYHKPGDDWNKINATGEKLVTDFIYDVTLQLANLESKPVFTEAGPKEQSAARRSFKVTFGIIPSYGSQAEGMEIDGVRKDGPADGAGMLKGDIIIAIEGKTVKDIYDYMYRLGELKKGQSVNVTVRRGEEELELTVQL